MSRPLVAQLSAVRVVPVLRSTSAEEAVTTARALAAGGMTVIELTFSTPGVLDAVRELAAVAGTVVGVGTVTTERQALNAIEAGAGFVVSPVLTPWLPALASDAGVGSIVGAATPTEIWMAHDAGADAVKVFPIARLGGARYVRDVLAPLPHLRLVATGGVDASTAGGLLAAGCVAVGVGSVRTADDPANATTTERARRFLAVATSSRGDEV